LSKVKRKYKNKEPAVLSEPQHLPLSLFPPNRVYLSKVKIGHPIQDLL